MSTKSHISRSKASCSRTPMITSIFPPNRSELRHARVIVDEITFETDNYQVCEAIARQDSFPIMLNLPSICPIQTGSCKLAISVAPFLAICFISTAYGMLQRKVESLRFSIERLSLTSRLPHLPQVPMAAQFQVYRLTYNIIQLFESLSAAIVLGQLVEFGDRLWGIVWIDLAPEEQVKIDRAAYISYPADINRRHLHVMHLKP